MYIGIYVYVLRKTWDRSTGGGEFRKFNRWTLARVKDDSFRRFVNRVTLQVLAVYKKGRKTLWSFVARERHIDPIIFVLILARPHVAITSILLNY